jgi:hypothetical protein
MLGLAAVETPAVTPWAYGLLDAAQLVNETGRHWQMGVEYETDACAVDGFVWAMGCGVPFSVTLTKTAVANQFSVAFNPTTGPYEASVNGGAYTDFANGGTFTTVPNPSTVTVREKTGLKRSATISGINPGAAQGVTFAGSSTARAGNAPKTGTNPEWVTGTPFAVGVANTCLSQALSGDWADEARRKLGWVEGRMVERVVWDTQLATAGAEWATGAGTAVPLRTAVGRIEEALANAYGGNGVLHAPRRVGAHAVSALLARTSATAKTYMSPMDNVWSFGGGYSNTSPAGVAAPEGTAWIYGTGVVRAHRSQVLTPAGAQDGAFDPRTNEVLIVAERVYVVTADCPRFAVLATLED